MASYNVGLVCGSNTHTVFAVINPDDDAELDNPRLLLVQADEPTRMVRMERDAYMACTSHDEVQAFATQALSGG